MRAGLKLLAATLLLVCLGHAAVAEAPIGATVNVRATRDVRDSVIRAGEDVDLLVTLTGFSLEICQWYREGEALAGENMASLHLEDAEVSDTGVYRMDALDADGRVRVSVDVALRVVDDRLPQTGDGALPAAVPMTAMGVGASAALILMQKRRRART